MTLNNTSKNYKKQDITVDQEEMPTTSPVQLYLFDCHDYIKPVEIPNNIYSVKLPCYKKIKIATDIILYNLPQDIYDKIRATPKTGRPGLSTYSAFCIQVYFSLFNKDTMRECVCDVRDNPLLREAMEIPNNITIHESTVSKKCSEILNFVNMKEAINKFYQDNKISKTIEHLSIDSTIVEAREHSYNHMSFSEYQELQKQKMILKLIDILQKSFNLKEKRHRRTKQQKKLDDLQESVMKMIEALYGKQEDLLKDINRECAWTSKLNSKGRLAQFRGYKIHALCDDYGVIVAYEITGANVNDQRLFVPLTRACPVDYKYVLADKGYFNQFNELYEENRNHIAIIDKKNTDKKEKDDNSNKLTPEEYEHYKHRTKIERAFGEMKECFFSKDCHLQGKRLKFQFEISLFLYNVKRLQEVKAKQLANVA